MRRSVQYHKRHGHRIDEVYLAWIRTLPCIGEKIPDHECQHATSPFRARPHHEPPVSRAGEWHDHRTLPMCDALHDFRHFQAGSKEQFEKQTGISVDDAIRELRARYNGGENGEF